MCTHSRSALLASMLLLSGWSTTAGAQTVTKFPIPSANSNAQFITRGPDSALWFTEAATNKIGKVTISGTVTEFAVPTVNSLPAGITRGPDGNLWFTESAAPGDTVPGGGTSAASGAIGRITTKGVITEFPIPTPSSHSSYITYGPDGNLWFTETTGNKIGQITTSGKITEFAVPTANSRPAGIISGPDGKLYFAESNGNKIGQITTSGVITESTLGGSVQPVGIANGPDGNLWFTDATGNIGQFTIAATTLEFIIPASNSKPSGIVTGPDGSLYFVESGGKNVGRIASQSPYAIKELQVTTNANGIGPSSPTSGPDGAIWFPIPNDNVIASVTTSTSANGVTLYSAILPGSRSVKVGVTATAFATLINNDTSTAKSCSLVFQGDVPATFTYQTTSSTTNGPTGTPNTPVDIPAKKSQSFYIAVAATAPFVPTDVGIGFTCTNENATSNVLGVNTILLSATKITVPDLVALAASQDPGIVDIPGTTGTGAFAIATVNIGSGDTITVTPDTGLVPLPVTLSVCQTVPSTGACMVSPTPSVTTTINPNQTPTFAVFVTGTGTTIPFAPGLNRIFVRLKDSTSATRGSTSVAVRTQ